MRLVRTISLACGLGVGLLAGPSAALGATTIGSDLAGAGIGNANCTGGVTYLQRALPGRPLLAPTSGVVTRWNVRDSGGTLRLRIVDPLVGTDYFFLRSSATETGDGPGTGAQSFPARLRITAGDGLAIFCDGPSGIRFQDGLGGTYLYSSFFPSPADGAPATGSNAMGNEIFFNAEIEPDIDDDVYGDETQDKCLGTAGSFDGCPNTVTIDGLRQQKSKPKVKLTVTVPGPGTLVVGPAGKQSIRPQTRTLTANTKQQVALILNLTKSARRKLAEKGKLKVRMELAYTPPGGSAGSQPGKVKLKGN
jgi:hypothetical protein